MKIAVTTDLTQAIARAISYSAGVVLAQKRVPNAAQLSGELGNNCAQHVVLLLEKFLEEADHAPDETSGPSTHVRVMNEEGEP
jgi:hypothetical protein